MKGTKNKWQGRCDPVLLVAMVGAGALLCSCNQRGGDASSPMTVDGSLVLATVDGTAITEKDFRYWWKRNALSEDKPSQRREILEQLVQRAALVNEARAAGLDKDPAVQAEIESFLIAKLKESELQPRIAGVTVTDEEAELYFFSHSSDYTESEQLQLAVLWFDTHGQIPLVQRYRARLERVRQAAGSIPVSKGFGTLAISNSEHKASRFKGGILGWISTEPGNNSWRNTVLSLGRELEEPGELSPVRATRDGLFLVRLVERRPAQVPVFSEVRNRIVQKLLREKRQRLRQEFLTEHGTGAAVRIHEDRLWTLERLPSNSNPSLSQQ